MSSFPPKKFHILFVEDETNLIETHTDILAQKGYQISFVRTVNQAFEYISHPKSEIHLVVIDLFLPQDFSKLSHYEKMLGKEGVTMNQGRLIGFWLSDKHTSIKYCYLTAEPGRLGCGGEHEPTVPLFSKSFSDKRKFIDQVDVYYRSLIE